MGHAQVEGASAAATTEPGQIRGASLDLRGDVAEWLRSGLQSRLHRFDSGRRLWLMRVCGRASQGVRESQRMSKP